MLVPKTHERMAHLSLALVDQKFVNIHILTL